MVAEKDKDVVYVGIKDPVEIRRSILESSKDVVQLLQRYEKFKTVRKERQEEVDRLKQLISSISRDIAKLKASLPKTSLRFKTPEFEEKIEKKAARMTGENVKKKIKGKKGKKISSKKKEKKIVVAKPKIATQLDKLESELGEIESKLGKLV
ncbi:hypothetical protein DRJ17_03285 [Candidatus Woesearchaeota archaeon]|nr:MAG: hypothetical protein DRJ17_03285 [Candidatus Woesearchaeota archaeon]